MVHVLVGGKKREHVLEDHLRRVKEKENVLVEYSRQKNPGIIVSGIEVEPTCPKAVNATKYQFEYDISLNQLIESGYQRHLFPAESYAFGNYYLEGNLSSFYDPLYNEMFDGDREWVNVAVKADHINITKHPRQHNLQFYTKFGISILGDQAGFTQRSVENFEVIPRSYTLQEKAGRDFISVEFTLDAMPAELVKFLYNRPYESLPPAVQQGGGLVLERTDATLILTRGCIRSPHLYVAINADSKAGSRGMREVKKP